MTAVSLHPPSRVSISNGAENESELSPYFRDFDFGNLLSQWTKKETPPRGNSPTSNESSNISPRAGENKNVVSRFHDSTKTEAQNQKTNRTATRYERDETNQKSWDYLNHAPAGKSSFGSFNGDDNEAKNYYNSSFSKYFDGGYGNLSSNVRDGEIHNPKPRAETNIDVVSSPSSYSKSRVERTYAYSSENVRNNGLKNETSFYPTSFKNSNNQTPAAGNRSGPVVRISPPENYYRPKRPVTTIDMRISDSGLPPKPNLPNPISDVGRTCSFLHDRQKFRENGNQQNLYPYLKNKNSVKTSTSYHEGFTQPSYPSSPLSPQDFPSKRELDYFEQEMLRRQNKGKINNKQDESKMSKTSSANTESKTSSDKVLDEFFPPEDLVKKKSFSTGVPGDSFGSPNTDIEATSSWELISAANRDLASSGNFAPIPPRNHSVKSEPKFSRVGHKVDTLNVVHVLDESPTEVVKLDSSPRKPEIRSSPKTQNKNTNPNPNKTQIKKSFQGSEDESSRLIEDLTRLQNKLSFTNQKWFQIETLRLALVNSPYYPEYYKTELEKHAEQLCSRLETESKI